MLVKIGYIIVLWKYYTFLVIMATFFKLNINIFKNIIKNNLNFVFNL